MNVSVVPGVVMDVELSERLRRIDGHGPDGRRRAAVWAVVRLFTEPLGLVVIDLPEAGLAPDALLAGAVAGCRDAVDDRLAAVGLTGADLTADGVTTERIPPFVAGRLAAVAVAPPVTVVICTREHPDTLRDCLASLVAQELVSFDVLVVDNAPTSDLTRQVVLAFTDRMAVTYAVEPRPGLSRARNHALAILAEADDAGDGRSDRIVAWTDDDVRADRFWVAELIRAFGTDPAAVAVSGVVVPAELETTAQAWFEQFGGHSKGRGFTADTFGPGANRQSPLYPLPAFGVGANMAFRLGALRALGGFDEALGAGTPAQGGEDTHAFSRLLSAGATTLYRPAALVRHVHRTDLAGLRAQMSGYGTGLTAFYTALIRADPRVLIPLAALLPRALRDLTGKDSVRVGTIQADFPAELLTANRHGMLAGPWRYLRGRRAARRSDAGKVGDRPGLAPVGGR